jgi:alpha-tubulin suppressor-like RCC1 family protein
MGCWSSLPLAALFGSLGLCCAPAASLGNNDRPSSSSSGAAGTSSGGGGAFAAGAGGVSTGGVAGDAGALPGSVTALALGYDSACALNASGALKCWGKNELGSLGLGDAVNRGDAPGEMGALLPAIDVGTQRSVQQIAAGGSWKCALLDDATVKCWGSSSNGECGLADTLTRGDMPNQMGDNLLRVDLGSGRTAVALSAGAEDSEGGHTCAILDDGSVKCWGSNRFGALGLGDTVDRGDGSGPVGQMGDALTAVELGTGRTARAISVGGGGVYGTTCALLDDETVKCWGVNNFGQLGLGDSVNRGDQPDQMGDNLPTIALGSGRTARQLAVGTVFACALLDDGTVKCWGSNVAGGLGLGDTMNRGDQPDQMGDNLPPVDLGTGRTAQAIAAGTNACALLDDGAVKCWGDNYYGALGLGDNLDRGTLPGQMGDNLPPVDLGAGQSARALARGVGENTICALLTDGGVKCWGVNNAGQLGLGDTTSRGNMPGQMGDSLPAIDLGL